ncbi:(2Fe-2S)-binding protein [Deltaproteobacteria bacterium]|nr:(2Fe-2S)-binding protein [Deltaproteobacteria bacterium]
MLVCHCHAVNDHTIRRCVNDGARSRHEVREACGAGSTCGGCEPVIDRLIDLHRDASNPGEATGAQG